MTTTTALEDIAFVQQTAQALETNIAKVIQGKSSVIRLVLTALLSEGHVLLEDVPGVGKTRLAQALARSIDTSFKRIQFTPDLLPNDITGVSIFDEATRAFRFVQGPVFASIVLADEINRGTPRVQSSLIESMAEAMVTVDGVSYELPTPFFVIATQNPADFHGTYPLPEAQLDRFLMRLTMGYPTVEDEKLILDIHAAGNPLQELRAVAHAEDILKCQSLIRHIHVSDPIRDYIVTIVDATRRHSAFLYGCSPRASLALLRAAQASAALDGRNYILPRDIRDLALPVLAHRLPLRLQARGECSSSAQALQAILDQHPVEKWEGS